MAITTAQRTEILKLVGGMFNASPGAYWLGKFATAVDGGMSMKTLAMTLAATSQFKELVPSYLTVSEQAVKLMTNLGITDSASTGYSTAKTYFENAITAKTDLGELMYNAVTYLSAVKAGTYTDATATQFTATAALQENKATVSEYYSVTLGSGTSSTTVGTLQSTLTGVTSATTSVDTAKTTISTSSATQSGTTFTLTTALDTINGTSGNDTIKGDFTATATVNASDEIIGGDGTDLLKLYGAYSATNMPVSMKSIEKLELAASQADAAYDMSSYTKSATGITDIIFDNVTLLSGRTITTTTGQALTLGTGSAMAATAGTVTWAGSATDTSLTLNLAGYQGAGSAVALTVTGAATTTMNIAATGTPPSGQTYANQVSTLTLPATTTKVVVTGTGGLSTTATAGTAITEIDASGNSGGVSLNVDGTGTTLKFTGGSGNDTVTFGTTNTFTTADTVVGGEGTDTLEMQRAQSGNTSTAFTNITGFETLKVTNATTAGDTFNLDHFGVQSISFGATPNATTTVSNIASGGTISTVATGTIAATIKNNGTDDSITVKLGGASQTHTMDLTQFENLTVNVSSATTAAALVLTDPQMKTLTLTDKTASGTYTDLSVNLGTLGVVTTTVDLSGHKAATATNGVTMSLSGSAVNGATVTGSQNNDTITGSSQADTITSGEGADTITGGAGNDTITLTETTAAIDKVILSTVATNGTDTYKGFAVGTGIDTVEFQAADTTVATGTGSAVLTASTAALVTGGGNYTTSGSTTTSDVIEITTSLDTTVTLSGTSTGTDLLQALSSDTTAAGGITATTASDKCFFIVYQNGNAYMFHGDANGGGAGGTSLIEASEIKLVGVFETITSGAFVTGDILTT